MTVKPTQIQNLDRAVSDVYMTSLNGYVNNDYDGIIYREDIDSTKFVHAFLGGVPDFRNWNGPRIAKSPAIKEIAGSVEKQELTVEVPVSDLLSNRINRYLNLTLQMGIKAASLPEKMLADWLESATTAGAAYNNYDGVATFTQHTTSAGGSNNNDLSLSLSSTNAITAIETMMDYTNEEGQKLGIDPSHIIVPSALAYTARSIFENAFDASGASNILNKYPLKVIVNRYLTTTNRFYLVDARTVEPFILYVLQDPNEITVLNNKTDSNYFNDDKVIWGAVGRLAVRPGPYQYMLTSAG